MSEGRPGGSLLSQPAAREALLYSVLGWVALWSVLGYMYVSDLTNEQALGRLRSSHVVGLQKTDTDRAIEQMRADVLYLASLRDVHAFFADDHGQGALEESLSNFLVRMSGYRRIRLVDPAGSVLLCVDRGTDRPEVVLAARECVPSQGHDVPTLRRLSLGEVGFGLPEAPPTEGGQTEGDPAEGARSDGPPAAAAAPEFRQATSVLDPSGDLLGFLVLEGQGPALLNRLGELGRDFFGETLFLDAAGRVIHQAGAPEAASLRSRHFDQVHPVAWGQMEQRASGQFANDEGIFTFATVSLAADRETDGTSGTGRALKIVAFVSKARTLEGIAPAYTRHLRAGLVGLFAVFLLSSYVAYTRGARLNHDRTLAVSEQRLRELSARLLVAQTRERNRIARDLHDEVGQTGTAVHLHLQRATDAADPHVKDELIEQADAAVGGLLQWAHDLAGQLRAPLLEDLGLGEAVRRLVEEFEARTGASTALSISGAEDSISPSVAEESYRIVQEALTNVSRHARATHVTVRVEIADESLLLEVQDDGVGFDTSISPDGGFGIIGVNERVGLFGGRLELESAVGEGTTIRVTLPNCGPNGGPSETL